MRYPWYSRCTLRCANGSTLSWTNTTHRTKALAKAAAEQYARDGHTDISIGRVSDLPTKAA